MKRITYADEFDQEKILAIKRGGKQALIDYMSYECRCPKEVYTDSLLSEIIVEAIGNLIQASGNNKIGLAFFRAQQRLANHEHSLNFCKYGSDDCVAIATLDLLKKAKTEKEKVDILKDYKDRYDYTKNNLQVLISCAQNIQIREKNKDGKLICINGFDERTIENFEQNVCSIVWPVKKKKKKKTIKSVATNAN